MQWKALETQVIAALQNRYDTREINNVFRYLVQEFTGKSALQAMVFDLEEQVAQQILGVVQKMQQGASMQVALGYAYFGDIKLNINQHVLAPRPETEELVHWIAEEVQPSHVMMDIGTGSGCIPLWLKERFGANEIHAMDVSEEALVIARENVQANKLEITFHHMDVLALETLPVVVHHLISNPPYIPVKEKAQMSEVVLNNDPDLALFVPDNDPLLFYRKIAELGLKAIIDGGFLWFELHENYAEETAELVKKLGYKNVIVKRDMQEKLRMLKAQKIK